MPASKRASSQTAKSQPPGQLQSDSHRAASPTTGSRRRRRTWVRRIVLLCVLVAVVVLGRPYFAQFPISRAEQAIAAHEPESALTWLDRAEWIAGNRGEIEFLRARAERKLGQLERTREHLQKAFELGFPVERIEREQWLALAQSGQLGEVEKYLSRLLTDPQGDAAEICEAYVSGFVLNHRFAEALAILDAWKADVPDDPYPDLMRAKVMIRQRSWQDAANLLQPLVEEGTYPEAAFLLATAYERLDRLEEGLALYQSVPPDSEYFDAAQLGAAHVYRLTGEYASARAVLEELLERSPDDAATLTEFGLLEVDAGHYERAEQLLRQAGVDQGRNIKARYGLATALRGQGKLDEARAEFEWVREAESAMARLEKYADQAGTDPDDLESRYQAGRLCLEYGSEEIALHWLQSVLNYDPDHLPTHRALVELYERGEPSPQKQRLAKRHRQKIRELEQAQER